MSTTVTYKGSTLTTITNGTKTLKTAGTYMEDDVTIQDTTAGGSAVVVTEEIDENGGIIKHINAVDLSNDTVAAAVLLKGYTAHDFQGTAITGTYEGGAEINNQNKTVTPSTSQQSITADSGYTGLGTVTVKAIPTGSAGTPTASKGTVSNHSISITPSVTNTTGYITGGSKNGTAVSVSASELVSGTLSITSNGTKDVTNYESVSVEVPTGSTINNQDKSVTPTTSQQSVTADSGYTGLGTVTVGAIQTETKSATPSETAQTITPTSGKYLTSVSVGAISSTYVGSGVQKGGVVGLLSEGTHTSTIYIINAIEIDGNPFYSDDGTVTVYIPRQIMGTATSSQVLEGATFTSASGLAIEGTIPTKTSDDLSASGATVTIPAGYYTEQTTKSVSSGSVTGPTSLNGSSATVTTGTNTLTLTKTGVSTTPTVSAGYVSSATASTATVALTASVTTKAAATITPTTTNQTIAAGTYLTGAQTIAGDSNLVGSNILNGVSIFGVNGTVAFQTIHQGSTTPSSSLGVNGDIYIQI